MKQFLTNIFIFGVIFLILNQLPSLYLSPYYGNKYYLGKYKYFKKNQDKFNTVILGSSRLYRHLNPKILDGLLQEYRISSFNLAAPSTFNPEVYYLYEKLLETIETNSLKYAFIELGPLSNIASKNLYTNRNYYWHNLKYLNFSINYILASNIKPLKRKTILIKRYITSYFANTIFGFKELACNKSIDNLLFIGKNRDGFYSLNDEMIDRGGNNKFRKRITSFLKDPTIIKKRTLIANKAFALKTNKKFINEVHLIKILNLIVKSKQKGIYLIFIIPPKMAHYNKLLALKTVLPNNHIIEIANPVKYPELYQASFSFDIGHLNKKGANVFTKHIADEFNKIMVNHKNNMRKIN
jgi:hypothetical protein